MDALEQIARTVLYEGYVLWPYRRSSIKNQQRWTFGGIYPAAFAAASGGVDRSIVRADLLIEAEPGTRVDVAARFLQVVARQVMRLEHGVHVPVSELTIGSDRYLSWDEAIEREISISVTLGDFEDDGRERNMAQVPIGIPAGEAIEALEDGHGDTVGAIVRSWEQLMGTLVVGVTPLPPRESGRLYRIAATVANTAPWQSLERPDVVRRTMASAHIVLRSDHGAFVSTVDPPPPFDAEVAYCRNEGLWPVLVGDDGARDTVLAPAIILGDYPRIAPESPGDLFDGGEIDQLLILNILTLTEEEQREMRDSDPRAREILDRCTSLSQEELMRLHGTVRSMQPLSASFFPGSEGSP